MTAEFVTGVAFLMLPVALVVMVLPIWSERQSIARTAARESAREFVLTTDQQRARDSAMLIATNAKLKPATVQVRFEGDPRVAGSSVRSTVTVEVPAFSIPLLDRSSEAFTLEETHTEVVDRYRSVAG